MFEDAVNALSFDEERTLSEDFLKDAKSLDQEGAFADYQKRVAVALLYRNPFQARRLFRAIEDGVAGLLPEARAAFEQLLVWLSYGMLPDMSAPEVEHFFGSSDILLIFKEGIFYDLSDAARLRLAGEYDSESRDVLRERIAGALRRNESTLSQKNMSGSGQGSIAYWLKVYDAELGAAAGAFERATFENKPEVQRNLSKEEMSLVRQLFDFYEWLKQPSDSLAGFEEDAVFDLPGARYVLTNGVLIDITQGEETLAPAALGEQHRPIPGYGDIIIQSRKILQDAQGASGAVGTILANALASADVRSGTAALLLLAQLRQLDNLMEDPRFVKIVMDDLKKAGRDDNISGIRANPGAPQYLARLLKVILEDRLGLSHADAISFGARLAKILVMEGEKYQSIIKQGKWSL